MAEGRDNAEEAFDRFLAKYQAKYDKAADCLAEDRDALLAFYGDLGAVSKPSATFRQLKPRCASTRRSTSSPWWRYSNQTASGKPGAVQTRPECLVQDDDHRMPKLLLVWLQDAARAGRTCIDRHCGSALERPMDGFEVGLDDLV